MRSRSKSWPVTSLHDDVQVRRIPRDTPAFLSSLVVSRFRRPDPMKITAALAAGFIAALPALAPHASDGGRVAAAQKSKSGTEFATLTRLPSLGSNAEAHAVNDAGTIVVGHSFDRAGYLYAVKWTQQNGVWTVTALPYPGSAVATGVDNRGNIVGYGATAPRRAVFWPAAG